MARPAHIHLDDPSLPTTHLLQPLVSRGLDDAQQLLALQPDHAQLDGPGERAAGAYSQAGSRAEGGRKLVSALYT